MTNSTTEFTHTAYAYRRTGKKHGRMLECGVGRIDSDGNAHVHLDRTPINGFTGYVQLTPRGVTPEPAPEKPQRPGDTGGDAEDT
jgi:hypothetical protein